MRNCCRKTIASRLPIISKVSRQKHGIHQTPALHFVHLAERSALTLPADREAIYSSLGPASLPLARELTVATQRSQRSAVLTGSRCFPRTEFPQRLQSPVSCPATMRAQSGGQWQQRCLGKPQTRQIALANKRSISKQTIPHSPHKEMENRRQKRGKPWRKGGAEMRTAASWALYRNRIKIRSLFTLPNRCAVTVSMEHNKFKQHSSIKLQFSDYDWQAQKVS